MVGSATQIPLLAGMSEVVAMRRGQAVLDALIDRLETSSEDSKASRASVRVPFRRLTEQDDGRNRIEAVYGAWAPALVQRQGEDLQGGGGAVEEGLCGEHQRAQNGHARQN